MKKQAKSDVRKMGGDAILKQIEAVKLEILKLQSLERGRREKNVKATKNLRQKLAVMHSIYREKTLSQYTVTAQD